MRPLRQWRRERLLSLAALATAAGVTEKTIGEIERGNAVPRLGTMRKLTDTLGVAPRQVTEFAAVLGHDDTAGDHDDERTTVPADVIAGGV